MSTKQTDMTKWLTVGEAANRLGITMESVRRLLKSGRFEFKREAIHESKFNFRYLIAESSIDERLAYLKLVRDGRG